MAARPPLIALKDIRLQDGPRPLFEGVDLAIEPRMRGCLVGRNGAGKSTLMRLVMGMIEPDSGGPSGKRVAELKGVTKAFGDRVILPPFTTRILRGDRTVQTGARFAYVPQEPVITGSCGT